MKTRTQQIEELQKEWTQPRWGRHHPPVQRGGGGEITRLG